MSTDRPFTESVPDNIISLHDYRERKHPRLIRLAPELDNLEMLYSNDTSNERMFSLKILFWGLYDDGTVAGLVPWLKGLIDCPSLRDPLNGHWQGYHDPGIDRVFIDAPRHKIIELNASCEYFCYEGNHQTDIIQELPDTLGTHAVLTHNGFRSFLLTEVVSWRLLANGLIQGMLVDQSRLQSTPVLPGDNCLYPADSNPEFKYFFQHRIANKIKQRDPDTLTAMYTLID